MHTTKLVPSPTRVTATHDNASCKPYPLSLACLSLVGLGCVSGDIGPVSSGTGAEDGPGTAPAGLPGFVACVESTPPPVANEMKRLTHRELVALLTDTFGSSVVGNLSGQLALYPEDVLTDPDETFVKDHTADHVMAAFYIADALGTKLSSDRSALAGLAGECIKAPSPTQDCITEFISQLGAKVFRRPLTKGSADAETEQLLAAYLGETAPADGLRLLISRMMLAPDVWFHLEVAGAAEEKGLKLTPYEVASRISFAVTGTLPDAELLAAAQEGKLQDLAQVQQHVERLMQTPRGKQQVLYFFTNWLLLDHAPELSQAETFLDGIDSEGLAEEMAGELGRFIEHVVFTERGKFADLFMNESMFAKSDRLAKIYQTTQWEDGQEPTTSAGPYKGIVLRGNSLLSEAEKSSPILRGVFLRKRVLCEDIPRPSNDIISERPKEEPDHTKESNRDVVSKITASPACAACHDLINPMGFVFENFDSLGRWRTVEKVYSDGSVVAQHAIDTNVELEKLDSSNTTMFTASPEEVNAAFSKSDLAAGCLSRRAFRHQNLRAEEQETVADSCRLHSMIDKVSNSTLFDFFVESVANESIFYKAE